MVSSASLSHFGAAVAKALNRMDPQARVTKSTAMTTMITTTNMASTAITPRTSTTMGMATTITMTTM